ncbi:hypothetical protein HWC09_gp031 [Lactobacillus phage 3-521]|uniref:Uncharacterized protein n=1 Tax=Lactobacillus phage 3-521 TaxID=2510943 RepID=A0A4Y5FGS1_9CAUD|nr:hypothetical protein HWC09_gp031 [Lactobacillus phage 3-521]QBJ03688.1 hypothetical protein UCC3521_0150 [Lactobacillus phage 3-521]
MKDLRNIIADNNQAVEKAMQTVVPPVDNSTTLVGRLVQVAEPLDEYAGMIGRVLGIDNDNSEVIIDFTNSPFINAKVCGEYLDGVKEQVMDLFPLDEL